jgi:hypothetical protein
MNSASARIRKIGAYFLTSAILIMLVMAFYSLFNDSAFFIWNKTRNEILRVYYTFGTVLILGAIGYYFLDIADQIEKESAKG